MFDLQTALSFKIQSHDASLVLDVVAAAQVSCATGLLGPIAAEAVKTSALPEGAAALLKEPCVPDTFCPTLGAALPRLAEGASEPGTVKSSALGSLSDVEAPLGDT